MNLCFFFEGTGQGVFGRITNVTRLHDLCISNEHQILHLEPGPGTHFGSYLAGSLAGVDWRAVFRSARRSFEAHYQSLPPDATSTKVFVFGFSRGALLARHFASWLDKLGVEVSYLGIWDTVDSTIGLDVAEKCPTNVRAVRHAVAKDETRKFYNYVPIRPANKKQNVVEMLFPGSHSDIGGLYEDNHSIADLTLSWIAKGAKDAGMKFKRGVDIRQKIDLDNVVLHDPHDDASNLWGAFDKIKRKFGNLRLHRLCRALKKS